jgi:hypothetical protein
VTPTTCCVRDCTTRPQWVATAEHRPFGPDGYGTTPDIKRTLPVCGRHLDGICHRLSNDVGTPSVKPWRSDPTEPTGQLTLEDWTHEPH